MSRRIPKVRGPLPWSQLDQGSKDQVLLSALVEGRSPLAVPGADAADVATRMASPEFRAKAAPLLDAFLLASRLHAGFLRASMVLRASSEDSRVSAREALKVFDGVLQEASQAAQDVTQGTGDDAVEAALRVLQDASWKLQGATAALGISPISPVQEDEA